MSSLHNTNVIKKNLSAYNFYENILRREEYMSTMQELCIVILIALFKIYFHVLLLVEHK